MRTSFLYALTLLIYKLISYLYICSYFGVFLLDGQVCPALATYKGKLKATPPSLVKSWSNLNESVVRFKRALSSKQINTREKLHAEWARNPNCKCCM